MLAKLDQAEFMLYDPTGLKILVLSWRYIQKVKICVRVYVREDKRAKIIL